MVRHEPPGGQIAEGRNINQAGRDYIENIGLIVDPFDLQLKFDKIDKEISGAIGDPVSPTADGAVIKYSSEKLFTSLIHVGLSPINAFGLIQDVGRYITDEIQLDKSRFSTAHIRKAVSNAILESPKLQMSRSDRRSQANKYARNYGNPLQITMVVYSNGDSTPIRYEYIMKTLLPNIIGKYTNNVKVFRFHGNDPDNFGIDQKGVLSINNLSHMAQELLNSVRRLGVYQIRYQTLFAIGEELALQLPHPWIVSSQSRIDTVLHETCQLSIQFP